MTSVTTLLGQEKGRVADFLSKINTHAIAKRGVNLDLAIAVFAEIKNKDTFLLAAEEVSFDNDLSMGFGLFKSDDLDFFKSNKQAILTHVAKMIGDNDNDAVSEYIYDQLYFDIRNDFKVEQVKTIISTSFSGNTTQLLRLNKAIGEWAVKMSILQTCRTWNTYMANNMAPLTVNK